MNGLGRTLIPLAGVPLTQGGAGAGASGRVERSPLDPGVWVSDDRAGQGSPWRMWEAGMRAVVQRVSRARVLVAGEEVGSVGRGLLVFLGVAQGDGEADLEWMARKIVSLRVFPDEEGKMNRSVQDLGGAILLVSQFTLCADVGKGTRPSFGGAMAPEPAAALFDALCARVAAQVPVARGRFGAHMEVELTNDGPVTLWLDTQRASTG